MYRIVSLEESGLSKKGYHVRDFRLPPLKGKKDHEEG